jgi:hypothetical protein
VLKYRAFDFNLNNNEQIISYKERKFSEIGTVGTGIRFIGIREKNCIRYFPKKSETFLRYFSSHFIADFLVGSGPEIIVNIDNSITKYPEETKKLVVGDQLGPVECSTEKFENLKITAFTCLQESSTGLEGYHNIHLLADGRAVETRKVDNLVGVQNLKRRGYAELALQICVEGDFLNERVNEGRTAFNIPEKALKELIRECVGFVRKEFIPEEVAEFEEHRKQRYEDFVDRYPIYGFDSVETQLRRVPVHVTDPEDFASSLVKYQIRRDEGRQELIQELICRLEGADRLEDNFTDSVAMAAREIHESEELALAQHVVRRKLVLEAITKLLKRNRRTGGGILDNHLEKTLHAFICPMHIRGDDALEKRAKAHDLWIVDERLTFTRAFSSDKRFDTLLKTGGSAERADVILWDFSMGLGITDPSHDDSELDVSNPLDSVMIVEFKKPGRKDYKKPEDVVEQQIIKYIKQLKNNEVESFDMDRIRISDDCVFYCYVIADIVGDLKDQLSSWDPTSNGRGRLRYLQGDYRGSIEVIQWHDLVNDAWMRNAGMLQAAGIRKHHKLPSS